MATHDRSLPRNPQSGVFRPLPPEFRKTLEGQAELSVREGGFRVETLTTAQKAVLDGWELEWGNTWDEELIRFVNSKYVEEHRLLDEGRVPPDDSLRTIRHQLTDTGLLCMLLRKWNTGQWRNTDTPWFRKEAPEEVLDAWEAVKRPQRPGIHPVLWYPSLGALRPHVLYNEEQAMLEYTLNSWGYGHLVDPIRKELYKETGLYFEGESTPASPYTSLLSEGKEYGYAHMNVQGVVDEEEYRRFIFGALENDANEQSTFRSSGRFLAMKRFLERVVELHNTQA